ncbi:MAG: helix-turn-helix domain-containing protein [Alphaproteobacteria bacterium]|nr:helix-turn-helix domain-containing protein [Alphaproteobacteria bacterium]
MEATKVDVICINQMELAARWRISHRTLERWRWTGEGPKLLKVGGRVVYRLTDIEEYEEMMIRSSTSGVRDAHQFSA